MNKKLIVILMGLILILGSASITGCTKQLGEDSELSGGAQGEGEDNIGKENKEESKEDKDNSSEIKEDKDQDTNKPAAVPENKEEENNHEIIVRITNKDVFVDEEKVNYEKDNIDDLLSKLEEMISKKYTKDKQVDFYYLEGNYDIYTSVEQMFKDMGIEPVKHTED